MLPLVNCACNPDVIKRPPKRQSLISCCCVPIIVATSVVCGILVMAMGAYHVSSSTDDGRHWLDSLIRPLSTESSAWQSDKYQPDDEKRMHPETSRTTMAAVARRRVHRTSGLDSSSTSTRQDQSSDAGGGTSGRDFQWNYTRITDDPEVVCKQYDLPTYAPWMMKFIQAKGPLTCWEKGAVEVKGDTVFVKHGGEAAAIRCNFTEIYRHDDRDYMSMRTNWSPGPYKLQFSDAVEVQCLDFNTGKSWHETRVGARRLAHLEDQTGWTRIPNRALPLNVLVWAFDSTSKNNFIRKMTKSWPYMRDRMNGVLMDGYNVLGESTFSALCPLFIGRANFAGAVEAYVEDILPTTTIFDIFQKAGYVTAFVEDEQNWGTFQHWGEGFRREPADHFTRPYMMERASILGHASLCCFGETCNNAAQTYVRDLWETYLDKPKFVFTLQGTYSHDDPNKLNMVDDEFFEYLGWMNRPEVANNTMIIIMADHGPRSHAMTLTRQGTLELRRPLMYIVLPEWVEQQWPLPVRNLRVNSKRLVTTMDLHFTFKNLLGFQDGDYETVPSLENLPRGLSMFKPMPKGRTCAMAEITSHYCACKNVRELSPGGDMKHFIRKLANKALESVNKRVQEGLALCLKKDPTFQEFVKAMAIGRDNVTGLLPNADQYHPFCRDWKLEKVERAHAVIVPTADSGIEDTKLFTFDGENKNLISSEYELSITAMPGPSHFLATVWLENPASEDPKVEVDFVTRLDWFSPNAKCIAQVCPSLEKYCYC